MATAMQDVIEQMIVDLKTISELGDRVYFGGGEKGGNLTNAGVIDLGGPVDVHAVQIADDTSEICIEVFSKNTDDIYSLRKTISTFWEDAARLAVLSALGLLDIQIVDVAPQVARKSGGSLDLIFKVEVRRDQ